ncbi:hypothetical protein HNE04_27420 [Caenimonas sp. S4]|nr:hypothetical protein [Caenimonas soli]
MLWQQAAVDAAFLLSRVPTVVGSFSKKRLQMLGESADADPRFQNQLVQFFPEARQDRFARERGRLYLRVVCACEHPVGIAAVHEQPALAEARDGEFLVHVRLDIQPKRHPALARAGVLVIGLRCFCFEP